MITIRTVMTIRYVVKFDMLDSRLAMQTKNYGTINPLIDKPWKYAQLYIQLRSKTRLADPYWKKRNAS